VGNTLDSKLKQVLNRLNPLDFQHEKDARREEQTLRLSDLLQQKKEVIVKSWIDVIRKTYPPETAQFLKTQKNRFANPIGASIEDSVWPLYDQLIGEPDPETTKKHLDVLIRVRAVQDFSPAAAVQVIFALKQIIREELMEEIFEFDLLERYLEFESTIDRFALLAFDVFMECREMVWQIKRNDLLKRPYILQGGMCPSYMLRRGKQHLEKLEKEKTQH